MKHIYKHIFLIVIVSVVMGSYCARAQKNINRVKSFDNDWHFTRDSVTGAALPGFDDSKWRILDLPHDWSIEDIPHQNAGITVGPFSKESPGDAATGRTIGGTGWYRKTFTLNASYARKLITIYFEGAYMETDVWVNGHHAGEHKYGYTAFYFDITKYCKPAGQSNVIAVRVANKGKNSRWYSGSGIYRHVQLIATDPVHIDQWGVYITTPQVSNKSATVAIQTKILNETNKKANVKIQTSLLDVDGKEVERSEVTRLIDANSNAYLSQSIEVKAPKRWSLETPSLYKARLLVIVDKKIKDVVVSQFGIRDISFSVDKGFLLDGKSIKLQGGCVHHDNGVLGAAAIDRAEERKIELLKANGFNAIRCSHNPPSEKFLQACDSLGMLVIDESFDQWEQAKNPDDYHRFFDTWWKRDFSSMIRRDRNHPSIILWSVGNEIPERAEPSGAKIVNGFKTILKQLDPSRSITEAICDPWDHPGKKWDYTEPAFTLLDVGGYNYQWRQYENDHKKFPDRIMIGTESVPHEAFQNWSMVEKYPYVIGDFVWTAMDYLGESGIGHTICKDEKGNLLMPWPWFNSYCGDIDLIGNKKPQSYYRDIVWRRSKIEIAVHVPFTDSCKEHVSFWGWPDEMQSWTWRGSEGKMMHVNVYSRSARVRLMLNGKTIGEKTPDSLLTARFDLPYAPGELKAIAVENGKETASIALVTTGTARKLRLVADRSTIKANRNDLSYITLEVTDENGNTIPNAEIPIQFTVNGKGELAGIGNSNPQDMASFQQPECKTFRGKCLVVLRPKGTAGDMILEAKAAGLTSGKIVVHTK